MNLFKKTLLASAVAVISSGAMAVDVQTASVAETFGAEALSSGLVANDGSVLLLPTVTLTSGAEYTVGDIITITIAGGEFAAGGAYTLTDVTGAGNLVTFGLLNATATELTFRVTALTNAATTVGQTFELAGAAGAGTANAVKLDSTTVGSKISVTAKAETSTGIKLDDTSKDTIEIGSVIAEHSISVDPQMAAVIDVTKERKEFVAPAVATFDVTHVYTAADQAPMVGTANTISVNGKLAAFPGPNDEGKLWDGTTALTVADDNASASIDYAAAPATKTLTFVVGTDATKRKLIEKGAYTASMTVKEGGKEVTLSSVDAGEFTLNGSVTDISYVPYGDNLEQFLWVTNKGVLAGEITVDAFTESGTTYGPYALGTVEAGQIVRIAGLLEDALEADGFTSGRLALTVTVNAPKSDVTVYAAYKVASDADRLTLPTQPQ